MDCFSGKIWHHLPSKEVLEIFQVDQDKGLDTLQVKWRTDEFGPNALTARRGKTKLERFMLQFHQPLIYILIVAGIITAALGEVVDSAVIVGVVLVNAIVGYIQEAKAVGALEALARSMVTEAVVIRSGATKRIPAEELVPGDVVVLRSGDKVPADLRLISVKDLRVDESALTGESVPVGKLTDLLPQDAVLGDRRNMAYASTLVTYGQATGVVIGTGDCTEIGRISTMVSEADELATPLTRKITSFSHILLWAILGLAALTFLAGVLRGEKAADMFMAAVALAVGAIPEGLPAAVTVILAMGVSRMAARGAIIRKLPAVETLGGASVICSDKTGTLTENQMTVTAIFAGRSTHEVSGAGYRPEGKIEGFDDQNQALRTTLLAGLLCNDTRIEYLESGEKVIGDPTEAALIVAAGKSGLDLETESKNLRRIDTLPFESEHQYMATLHDQGADTPRLAFFKGSVETVLDRAAMELQADGTLKPLDPETIRNEIERLGIEGMRVLAIACKELPAEKTSLDHEDVSSDLIFLGLTAMIDPPRPEAIKAVQAFHRAGVNVKMITGDHAVTAAAIGVQLGLGIETCPGRPTCQVMSGSDMALMSDDELIAKAADTAVFARVAPDQKLRLVMALQSRGEVVAMTGDGVNDAPALKKADIGIAMGITGTDVTKEAASMTLTDDNFASIVAAVEEGRGVFGNIKKYLMYLLSSNIGEIGLMAGASLFGFPLPLSAVQILYVNLATDGLPALALAVDPPEEDIMNRPPRSSRTGIFTRPVVLLMLVGGIWSTVINLGLFTWILNSGRPLAEAMTMTFISLVLIQFFKAYNYRSDRNSITNKPFINKWLNIAIVWELVLIVLIIYVPFLQNVFGTFPLSLNDWVLVGLLSMSIVPVIELAKWVQRRGWFGALD